MCYESFQPKSCKIRMVSSVRWFWKLRTIFRKHDAPRLTFFIIRIPSFPVPTPTCMQKIHCFLLQLVPQKVGWWPSMTHFPHRPDVAFLTRNGMSGKQICKYWSVCPRKLRMLIKLASVCVAHLNRHFGLMWLKFQLLRSSHRGSVVTNLTRVHEDGSLIPGLAHWVKDPLLPWTVV